MSKIQLFWHPLITDGRHRSIVGVDDPMRDVTHYTHMGAKKAQVGRSTTLPETLMYREQDLRLNRTQVLSTV